MKTISATLLAALAAGSFFACTNKQNETEKEILPWDAQQMSMYIEQGCLSDSAYIDRIDFANFDNVYMMDRPYWKSQEHFDSTIDSIAASDGSAYKFTKDDLFAYAVKSAQAAGTKALFTCCNDMLYGALDDDKRAKMVKTIIDVVRKYDFDGVDVDWEIDLYKHKDKHADMMQELRQGLTELGKQTGKDYLLTTAMSVEAGYPDSLQTKLAEAIDWVNVMSYDIGGCLWRNHATHNTALDIIKKDIKELWGFLDPKQLHLGLASYGFLYTDILPGEVLPEGDNLENHGRYALYNELLPQMYGPHHWVEQYDSVAECSYFINPDKKEFITADTPRSIRKKFEFAKEAGLGGTFWWEYCKDVVPDNNGGDKWMHILVPKHTRQQ